MTMADARGAALSQFASVARRCRAGAGYPDARSFYKAFGGASFFGCTYKAFAGVEAGSGLPQPRLVEKIVAALRLPLRERMGREFALAYLRLFLGSEEFLDLALGALSEDAAPAAAKPPRRELRLSPRQSALLRRDRACYWCFAAGRGERDLSEALGLPAGEIRKALGRLKAAGLTPGDGADRRVLHPGGEDQASADLRKHWSLPGASSLMEHPLLLRASEAELRQYLPLLADTLREAEAYEAGEKGSDAALFLVEARVRKLVSF